MAAASSQCCGHRAQAAARCVAATEFTCGSSRGTARRDVREPPEGTVASTRDALGGAWCAAW
eukprot:1870740-Prymnesium_polylepis.1